MSAFVDLVGALDNDQYRYVKEIIQTQTGPVEVQRKEYNSPTEFILSLSKKKSIAYQLRQPFYEKDIPILLRLLSLLNAFRFSTTESRALYSFLCGSSDRRRCSPDQLVATAFSYSYPTVDALPYYYVASISTRISPMTVGDYASDTVYIIEILGVMLGFVFTRMDTDTEKAVLSHFDTPVVKAEFQRRYPRINL